MNDVKLNTVDFAAKQGSSASASPPNSAVAPRESGVMPELIRQQELKRIEEQQSGQAVEAKQQSVAEAVTKLNDYVQSVQRDLQFKLDDDSGKTIITVVDSRTSEVVRQIPDDVALKLAQDLQQDEPLSLFNAKV